MVGKMNAVGPTWTRRRVIGGAIGVLAIDLRLLAHAAEAPLTLKAEAVTTGFADPDGSKRTSAVGTTAPQLPGLRLMSASSNMATGPASVDP